MSLEENMAIVRQFIDAYNKNKQNLDVLDEFLAPDYFDHTHQSGPDGVKQVFKLAFQAFMDWYETIEENIAEGDNVLARVKATGTRTGEWMGLAPTGKNVTSMMVDIFRVVNGNIGGKNYFKNIADNWNNYQIKKTETVFLKSLMCDSNPKNACEITNNSKIKQN